MQRLSAATLSVHAVVMACDDHPAVEPLFLVVGSKTTNVKELTGCLIIGKGVNLDIGY